MPEQLSLDVSLVEEDLRGCWRCGIWRSAEWAECDAVYAPPFVFLDDGTSRLALPSSAALPLDGEEMLSRSSSNQHALRKTAA